MALFLLHLVCTGELFCSEVIFSPLIDGVIIILRAPAGHREEAGHGQEAYFWSLEPDEELVPVWRSQRWVEVHWEPAGEYFALIDHYDGHESALRVFYVNRIEESLPQVRLVHCSDDDFGRFQRQRKLEGWTRGPEGEVVLHMLRIDEDPSRMTPSIFTESAVSIELTHDEVDQCRFGKVTWIGLLPPMEIYGVSRAMLQRLLTILAESARSIGTLYSDDPGESDLKNVRWNLSPVTDSVHLEMHIEMTLVGHEERITTRNVITAFRDGSWQMMNTDGPENLLSDGEYQGTESPITEITPAFLEQIWRQAINAFGEESGREENLRHDPNS